MPVKKMKIAILGSGRISKVYIPTIRKEFGILEIVGGWDPKPERAMENEERFGVKAMTKGEILADPNIEAVLNLTKPESHYEITKEALLAGKHVYSEKMIALTMEQAKELLEIAEKKNLAFTVAPDTFLGGAWQTARKLIDDGYIGTPLLVNAVAIRSYQLNDPQSARLPMTMRPGGGIPYDMGGYYLHAMFHLLGGLRKVTGFVKTANRKKCFRNPQNPSYKEVMTVSGDAPNTMTASMEFENGVYGSLIMTSESDLFYQSEFVIYGTQGTLILPDPNCFGGEIRLRRTQPGGELWESMTGPINIPLTHGYTTEGRGIGAADMAWAVRNGRVPRADARMGYHAFEAIQGIRQSCENGRVYCMTSEIERPAPVMPGVLKGTAQEMVLDDR